MIFQIWLLWYLNNLLIRTFFFIHVTLQRQYQSWGSWTRQCRESHSFHVDHMRDTARRRLGTTPVTGQGNFVVCGSWAEHREGWMYLYNRLMWGPFESLRLAFAELFWSSPTLNRFRWYLSCLAVVSHHLQPFAVLLVCSQVSWVVPKSS